MVFGSPIPEVRSAPASRSPPPQRSASVHGQNARVLPEPHGPQEQAVRSGAPGTADQLQSTRHRSITQSNNYRYGWKCHSVMTWFKPKHTFRSVVQELVEGLENGTIFFPAEAVDQPPSADAPIEGATSRVPPSVYRPAAREPLPPDKK